LRYCFRSDQSSHPTRPYSSESRRQGPSPRIFNARSKSELVCHWRNIRRSSQASQSSTNRRKSRAVRGYSTLADEWTFQYEQPSKLSDGIQPCVLIASMSTPIGDIVLFSWYCGGVDITPSIDRWIRMVHSLHRVARQSSAGNQQASLLLFFPCSQGSACARPRLYRTTDVVRQSPPSSPGLAVVVAIVSMDKYTRHLHQTINHGSRCPPWSR